MSRSVLNSTASQQRTSSGASAHAPVSSRLGHEAYATGRVLSGRFRIEHLIGMGSMGVVLAARHIELDTRVAIKAILPEMQALPGVLSRFAREAKAAVAIRSEHVAQVFDVGTDDELGPYIVMEYLEGRDLRAALELDGRVPLRRAVDYVLQACEALAAAHAKGVIHRDIKPENLFLTRQGDLEVVKLLDFGISQAALTGRLFGGELSAEEPPCLMGTPLYMSPEHIQSLEEVDRRADIWSLGAVLYELVSGRSAFSGTDPLPTLLANILGAAPAPLAEFCSEAEAALQGVIDRCLDKNPARRFQDVAELAYALLPFAASRARLHAQRAASILGNRDAIESSALASPVPLQPTPSAPASVLVGERSRGTPMRPPEAVLRPARGSSSLRLVAASAIGVPLCLLLAVCWLWTRPTPVRAERIAVMSSPGVSSPGVSSPPEPTPSPEPERTAAAESSSSAPEPKVEPPLGGPAKTRSIRRAMGPHIAAKAQPRARPRLRLVEDPEPPPVAR